MIYAIAPDGLITAKLDAVPTDGSNYGIWDGDLDLVNYDHYVGVLDDSHNIAWLNPPKPKPVPVLIQHMQDLKNENDVLGQTAAQLALDNMQLNSTVDTLRAMVAQSQLDIMVLKGGAAS
jgi:hypothetical protein